MSSVAFCQPFIFAEALFLFPPTQPRDKCNSLKTLSPKQYYLIREQAADSWALGFDPGEVKLYLIYSKLTFGLG